MYNAGENSNDANCYDLKKSMKSVYCNFEW